MAQHGAEARAGRITGRIEAVEREIERRDLLGGSTSDQADTSGRSPDADDQAEGLLAGLPPVETSTGAGVPPCLLNWLWGWF